MERIAICTFILFLALVCPGCTDREARKTTTPGDKVRLGVPFVPFELAGLVLLADEQGLFEKSGIRVTFVDLQSSPKVLRALRQGQMDMAIASEFPYVKNHIEDGELTIIASIAEWDSAVLIGWKDRGIHTPSDLKGKTVAVQMGGVPEFFLGRYLLYHGLVLEDIQVVNLDLLEIPEAFLSGVADATVHKRSVVAGMVAALGDKAVSWSIQSDQNMYGLVVSKPLYVQKNSNTVQRFVKAIREAESFLKAYPEEALNLIARRTKMNEDVRKYELPNTRYELALRQELLMAMEDEAAWLIENGYVESQEVPDFLDSIHFEALEAAKPEGIRMIR